MKRHTKLVAVLCMPAIIRAVNTKDAMTATVEEIPYAVLHKIVNRITSEVEGINRVLFDLTPKPTGTIDYESFLDKFLCSCLDDSSISFANYAL